MTENERLIESINDLSVQFLSEFKNNNCSYWGDGYVESVFFAARFPDREKLIRMADLTVRGHIQFWHPWHMELTHFPEKVVKPKEWLISRNGDPEWLDSLVRFTHMFDLAAAYKITGKKKYIDAFCRNLESFAKARSTSHRHWKDQLNAAIRVSNLIKSIDLFDLSIVSEQLIRSVIQQICIDCDFLYASLGKKVGNWEVAITTSLLMVSVYFDKAGNTSWWFSDAEQRLFDILQSDTHLDGVQVEEIPLYHGEVILFLMDYLTVLKANGKLPAPFLLQTSQKMLSVLDDIADPDGMIPPLGDSDRFNVSYIKTLGHLLTDSNDTVRVSLDQKSDIDAILLKTINIKVFENTGWSVMRWFCSENQSGYLLFDCSGKPLPLRSWHSHADDLNFILHTTEGALIVDPGRFTYAHEFPIYVPYTNRRIFKGSWKAKLFDLFKSSTNEINSRDWREYFRSTLSHNTVSCNGENQPYYEDTTSVGSFVKLSTALNSGALFLMCGEMDTARLGKCWNDPEQANPEMFSRKSSYRHSRVICGSVPDLIIVVDKLESTTARNWINSIHFSPECRIEQQRNAVSVILGSSHYYVETISAPSEVIACRVDQDWVSEVYNKKVISKTYRAVAENQEKILLMTIIYRKQSEKTLKVLLTEEQDLIKLNVSELSNSKTTNNLTILVTKEKIMVNNETNKLESNF